VAAGEKGGDADGDGVKAYGRRPGPTLTGSGDDVGVSGEEEEEAALLLMAGPVRQVVHCRYVSGTARMCVGVGQCEKGSLDLIGGS
jgi:hypothetical protein